MIGALARRAVVAPSRRERDLVELLHRFPASSLEREMRPARDLALRRFTLFGRDEQLVRPEVVGTFSGQRDLQYFEYGGIEAFARRKVFDYELKVIDQPAAVQFL